MFRILVILSPHDDSGYNEDPNYFRRYSSHTSWTPTPTSKWIFMSWRGKFSIRVSTTLSDRLRPIPHQVVHEQQPRLIWRQTTLIANATTNHVRLLAVASDIRHSDDSNHLLRAVHRDLADSCDKILTLPCCFQICHMSYWAHACRTLKLDAVQTIRTFQQCKIHELLPSAWDSLWKLRIRSDSLSLSQICPHWSSE